MSPVTITQPPSDDDRDFVDTAQAFSEAFQADAPEPQEKFEDKPTPDEQDERLRLEKFLGAKDRYKEPDTRKVYIASLDTDVVVRELHDKEAETVYQKFAELAQVTNRAQRRALGEGHQGLVSASAYTISVGLVSPDLRNPVIFAKFRNKFGEDLTLPSLITTIMKPGEILALNEVILDLTGSADDLVEEAKN